MMKSNHTNIAIFGAAPDTGNLGVTALSQSMTAGLWTRGIQDITVFDHGRGRRAMEMEIGPDSIRYHVQGAVSGYRLYRRENMTRAVAQNRIGLIANPIIRTVRQSAAVLDISGGDSFSDIYGQRRFTTITQPKHLALDSGTPLVLMPQTYGPFENASRKAEAADILRRSSLAFARDRRSHATMLELLGNHFDAARHFCGVDVAFGLPITAPPFARREAFMAWRARQKRRVIAFNVSGLLFNEPEEARRQFGLHLDFQSLALAFMGKLLEETDVSIVLLPHVLDRPGSRESDENAVRSVFETFSARFGTRLFVPEMSACASEAKWFISQCDWLTGARMHATIGALSSGVPALALAYSGKMQGVFETCGQGHSVIDLRAPVPEASVVDAMMVSLGDASLNYSRLAATLPHTLSHAKMQFDYITRHLGLGASSPAVTPGGARVSDAA